MSLQPQTSDSVYFTAFFDASGQERNGKPLAVAGYLSSKQEWLLFEKEWNATLGDFQLAYFHMVEFVNRAGLFKGWERRRRSELFDRLTTIIRSRVKRAFGCVILSDAYLHVNKSYFLTETLGHVFTNAAMTVMGRVHSWCFEQRLPYPVFTVFEDGDEHKGDLLNFAKRYLPAALRPQFQPKQLAPLQAADVAAWDLQNVILKVQQVAEVDIWGKSWQRLHEISNDYQIRGERELLAMCADLKIPGR